MLYSGHDKVLWSTSCHVMFIWVRVLFKQRVSKPARTFQNEMIIRGDSDIFSFMSSSEL